MIRTGIRAGCLAAVLLGSPLVGQPSARRVLHAADIAAGGWHRLGDVVAGMMPGEMASVDGFNVALTNGRIPFAGISAAGSPGWMIRLDGQRVPVAIDGMSILDQLPVAMTQVDSIVVYNASSIVDGQASLLGTIDVYTRRPVRGLSGVGDYQHGDESGDPGPYRYTPRATPNVEKLGPFTSGAVAYGGGGWSLDAAARYSSLNITDTSISRRFPGIFSELQSDVNSSGGSGVLTTSFGDGAQFTTGGRGRFTGLLWLPSGRHEESVRVITTQGGSSGDFLIDSVQIRYGLTGTSRQTSRLGTILPVTIDRNEVMNEGFAEMLIPGSSVAIGAGLTWWGITQEGKAPPIETRTTPRVWVDLFRTSQTHGLTAAIAVGGGQVAPSVKAWAARQLSASYQLLASVSSIQRIAGADGSWLMSTSTAAPLDSTIPVAPIRNTRLDEARVEIDDAGTSAITPSIDIRLVNASNWQLDPVFGSGDQTLQFVVLGAGFDTKPSSRVSGSFRAEGTLVHAGSSAMEAAVKSTPVASLRADVSRVVMTDFRLSASGHFTTSTIWPSGFTTDESPDLPALRRVDLSVNKPFWHQRIRAQVVVRNAFGVDERYHPVGASWNFRTHLSLTVALPPYSSADTRP